MTQKKHGKWKLLFDLQLRPFGGEAIFRGNLSKKDLTKYITISDAFTLEILQTFTDIRYEGIISSIEQFKAQSLWQNSLIGVGNRPICYRSWYSKGVKNVCHLIRDETSYLSFSDFKERYNIKTNFLTFQGVISAIKSLLKTYDVNNNSCDTKCENLIDTFLKTSKPSRLAYKILVEKNKNKRAPLIAKGNGPRIACLKAIIVLIGRWFTEPLSCAQKFQN